MKNILKNRTVMGACCIALALVLSFVVVPITEKFFSASQVAFKATEDIPKGALITDDMVGETKVAGGYGKGVLIADKSGIVGKYSAMEMSKEDIVTSPKVSSAPPFENEYLFSLAPGKVAISVAVPSVELGLSGKMRSGDIVSVLAVIQGAERQHQLAATPVNELQYVKVLSVQNGNADDITDSSESKAKDKSEKVIGTVTLEVNSVQAQILAGLNQNSTLHFALVARQSDKEQADALLKKQDEFFESYIPSELFASVQYMHTEEQEQAIEPIETTETGEAIEAVEASEAEKTKEE